MRFSTNPFILILYAGLLLTNAHAGDFLWIEGEAAESSTMREHGWYNSVKKGELSGGDWLSHFSDGEMPVAHYAFDSGAAGEHEFWLRANPIAGAAISVRVNDGNWQSVPLGKSEQQVNIASDGKPDMRFVAWIKGQPLTLREGKNTLDLRFESGNNRHGGIDCFVLSREPFLPQGNRKPGEKTGLADPGTWAFEPDRDKFSPDSMLDLTVLNEKPAGKHGRVARSADGADFVDGAGKPIRFWAVNTGVHNSGDLAMVEEHARWLAKRGVNMVRHHGHLAPGKGSKITDVNQRDIDAAWRLVAAMKKQGIYVTLSPYWAVSVKPHPEWGLKDAGGDNLTGLLFFDPDLQAAYKVWLKKLLTEPNPHTGIPLAKDPAVALFQIQNEDSLLFWTESSIKSEQRRALGDLFGKWLIERDGTLEKTIKAWGGEANAPEDDFTQGRVMPFPIWNLTQSPSGPMEKRLNDQLQFYTELMFDFNAEIARYLKEDLGYEGLVNAGNWRTADQAKLLDAERFAYTANDVIGVNRYYNGGSHSNPTDKQKAGYLVSEGDLFSSESALKRPGEFPLTLRQVEGHPMIISESSWVPPLQQQSEGPFLVAAYSALTGFDIFYWFATGDIGFGPPMGKWQISSPAQMGMFPAAALMFRQGYVQRGKPVVLEHRPPAELWARKSPMLPEQAGFDPNRDVRIEPSQEGTLTPLTYLVGGVEVAFEKGRDEVTDLKSLIDTDRKTVRSVTGQLLWNYDKGIGYLNAPKAKGIAGDLAAASSTKLGELTVASRNSYASLLVVSMDGADLAQSKRILIQVGTIARPHGWKTEPAGNGEQRITDLGSSPWNIENVDIDLQLKNAVVSKATALDANGLPKGDVPVRTGASGIELKLPSDSMYLILE
ncbi:MAG: hypothetical protein R3F19_20070 [Verrucomicrobiales bacterium]